MIYFLNPHAHYILIHFLKKQDMMMTTMMAAMEAVIADVVRGMFSSVDVYDKYVGVFLICTIYMIICCNVLICIYVVVCSFVLISLTYMIYML